MDYMQSLVDVIIIIVPMKGVFTTPDIVHFFNSTFDTEAKNYWTFDIQKSAGHSTLCLKKAKKKCGSSILVEPPASRPGRIYCTAGILTLTLIVTLQVFTLDNLYFKGGDGKFPLLEIVILTYDLDPCEVDQ